MTMSVSAQRHSDRFGGRNFDDVHVPGIVSFVVPGGVLSRRQTVDADPGLDEGRCAMI